MSGAISFGGLVSGLDTNSLVDKLVAAEKAPITAYQQHQTDDNAKLTTLGTLVSSSQALQAAAQALATSVQVNPLLATSSNPSSVMVIAGSGATAGNFAISVTQLARAQENLSTGFDTDAAAGDGTLAITVGASKSPLQITYKAGDTLESIASQINGQSGGVSAAVLFDGSQYHLTVTSSLSGTANGMTFADTGSALGFNVDGSQLVDPLDAKFTVNGAKVTRSSNSITDVIPGSTINLVGETPKGGAATIITLGVDNNALQAKVQTLVDSYNSVHKTLAGQLAYTGTKLGTNTLFGDSGLEKLQQDLGNIFAGSYGDSKLSAVQLGISLGKDGVITFDTAKFQSGVAADPTAAQQLFTGSTKSGAGLAQALATTLNTYTRSVDGVLTSKQDSITKDFNSYTSLIQKTTDAANALGTRLRAQFLAMEQALARLQTQSSILYALGAGASATTSASTTAANTSLNSTSSSTSSTTTTG